MLVGLIGTIIVYIPSMKSTSLKQILNRDVSFVSLISVGNVLSFANSSLSKADKIKYLDIILYLNSVGIIVLLIFSIAVRRKLIRINNDLDESQLTPSDYSVIARNLPLDLDPKDLKEKLQEELGHHDVKIVYVNPTYKIEEMVNLTAKLKHEHRKRALFKVHRKKYMKTNNLTKEAVTADPTLIPEPAPIKVGFRKTEALNLEEIDKNINEIEEKLAEYETQLAPGTEIDVYFGTAFVVFE